MDHPLQYHSGQYNPLSGSGTKQQQQQSNARHCNDDSHERERFIDRLNDSGHSSDRGSARITGATNEREWDDIGGGHISHNGSGANNGSDNNTGNISHSNTIGGSNTSNMATSIDDINKSDLSSLVGAPVMVTDTASLLTPLVSLPSQAMTANDLDKLNMMIANKANNNSNSSNSSDGGKDGNILSKVATKVGEAMTSLVPTALTSNTNDSSASKGSTDNSTNNSTADKPTSDRQALDKLGAPKDASSPLLLSSSSMVASDEDAKVARDENKLGPSEGPDAIIKVVKIDGATYKFHSQRDFEEKIGKFGAVAVKRKVGFFESDEPEMIFDYRKLDEDKHYTLVKIPTLDRLVHPPGPAKPMDFSVNLNLNIQMESHTRVLAFYGMVAFMAAVALHSLANIAIAFIR